MIPRVSPWIKSILKKKVILPESRKTGFFSLLFRITFFMPPVMIFTDEKDTGQKKCFQAHCPLVITRALPGKDRGHHGGRPPHCSVLYLLHPLPLSFETNH